MRVSDAVCTATAYDGTLALQQAIRHTACVSRPGRGLCADRHLRAESGPLLNQSGVTPAQYSRTIQTCRVVLYLVAQLMRGRMHVGALLLTTSGISECKGVPEKTGCPAPSQRHHAAYAQGSQSCIWPGVKEGFTAGPRSSRRRT